MSCEVIELRSEHISLCFVGFQQPKKLSLMILKFCSVSCDVLNMIRICGHNARGLTKDKLHRGLLGSLYSNHHLSFVFETWAEKDSVTATASLKGFTYIDFARDSRHPDARRGSGGIGLFISKNISKGVEIDLHGYPVMKHTSIMRNKHFRRHLMRHDILTS